MILYNRAVRHRLFIGNSTDAKPIIFHPVGAVCNFHPVGVVFNFHLVGAVCNRAGVRAFKARLQRAFPASGLGEKTTSVR